MKFQALVIALFMFYGVQASQDERRLNTWVFVGDDETNGSDIETIESPTLSPVPEQPRREKAGSNNLCTVKAGLKQALEGTGEREDFSSLAFSQPNPVTKLGAGERTSKSSDSNLPSIACISCCVTVQSWVLKRVEDAEQWFDKYFTSDEKKKGV